MATKKSTPIAKAKKSMSSSGTKSRVDKAEKKALSTGKKTPAKAAPKAKASSAYKPKQKHVDARAAMIAASQAADRKAIAEMAKKRRK